MSAKTDLRKAYTWVHNAEKLAKKHLDPYYYPLIMDYFQYLIVNLDLLAQEDPAVLPAKSEARHVS